MKNKLNIVLVILVAFVLMPQTVSASWWNPFSWKVFNRSSEVKIEKPITPPVNPANISTQTTKEEPKKLDQSVEIEKLKKEVEVLKKKPKNELTLESSWKGIEDSYFILADQQGLTTLELHNYGFNEDRYYVKENNKWVRKNSKAEIKSAVEAQKITNDNIQTKAVIPQTTTPSISPTPPTRKNYDKELSQLVADRRQSISVFQGAIKETEDFAPVVKTTMNKYLNEFIMQQSGQELLNENENLASISRKLVSIETNRANKISSYIGLGIIPKIEEFSQLTQQYNDYYQKYKTSKDKMTSLIGVFVSNEKTVLERLIKERQQTLEEKQQKLDNLKNSQSSSTPAYDPQIESAFSTLQTTLTDEENRQVSMTVITQRKEKAVQDWIKQNPNVFSSSTYIKRFNAILTSYGLYYMAIQ